MFDEVCLTEERIRTRNETQSAYWNAYSFKLQTFVGSYKKK